jgi:hypothetical protein
MARDRSRRKSVTRQKAQIGTAFIRAASRALARGSVLLLLFSHLAWAGAVCSCNHSDGARHACSRLAQRDNPAVETHQEGLDTHSTHCASPETLAPGSQFDNSTHGVKVCCQSAQNAGEQTVAISSTKQLPMENLLSPVRIGVQTTAAPASIYIHPQRRDRPLYLAFSCWRI